MNNPKKVECPYCRGDMTVQVGAWTWLPCPECKGSGEVTPEHAANIDMDKSYREILSDQKSCVDEDKMDAKRQGER